MPPETPPLTREQIRVAAYAFQESRILLTAYELGLFTALGSDRHTSAGIASLLGTDPRATDRLMNALCAMGLLEKENGRFSNSQGVRESLVRGSPDYLGGLMHTVHLWDTWTTLTEAVRTGTGVRLRTVEQKQEQWRSAFIAAMHDRAARQAPAVVGQIDLSKVTRVLDVGGGSGAYAMAFVRAKAGISATVFDLPDVIPLTRSYIEREGLSQSVATVPGDYLKDGLGKDFDIVFLSAIVHSNSPSENAELILKCARALRPGGRVVVQDFIMDEERLTPMHGAIFALNMLVGTVSGDTYTEAEVSGWMTAAGLSGVSRQGTPFGTSQISGRLI
jgi:2-polyprenyl-3-methyl-5-hydroxy-6-metoxy-1,4-benzoquinol methylase